MDPESGFGEEGRDGEVEFEELHGETAPEEAVLLQALERGEEGDWGGMAEILRGAHEDFPADPAILCWLATAKRELGAEGVAYDLFKQCLALNPEEPHILAVAGNGIASFDDADAESALRTAALMAPDLLPARLYYGSYLAREGLLPEAIRELDAARDLDPEDPEVALERGVALALSGDPAAEGEFDRAVSLDPEDGWARILQGLARLEYGDGEGSFTLAAEAFDDGARQRPDDLEAHLLASSVLLLADREDLAWEHLERARVHALGGEDLALIQEVEDRMDDAEAMLELLRSTLFPIAWRDRLMARP